jgi:hypothetical protein
MSNRDPGAIVKGVDRIERRSGERIKQVIDSLPNDVLAPRRKTRISEAVTAGEGQFRSSATVAGWF